ncbi:MAG: TPM domain-containing protein [Oscillospiraceae bacterium]|nr:TPM domain-containing protein [Oscillospiraceae bacterium]
MMTKRIISILFAVILVFGISVTSFAEEQRFVFDEASILTYDEIEEFEARAAEITEKYGCGVYLITFPSLDGMEAWELNELLYAELREFYGASEDIIILMLAMEERQYDILAHGYGNTVFTDYGKDVMAERFLDDFAIDDWYWGFNDYLDTCDEFLEMAANGEPFDVGSEPDSLAGNLFGVLIAVIVSCAIALVICLIFRAQMKTARLATEAHDYQKELNLTNQYDRFSHRDIRRVYNPPKEDNDGGGGTTINSGGFSHKSGGF